MPMSVVSEKTRIFYVVVPKAACTSIKMTFLELAGGAAVPPLSLTDKLLGRRVPKPRSVHQIDGYITAEFGTGAPPPAGFARISVVRDPLARLHSAWSNKVGSTVFGLRGELEALQAAGLPLDPSFGAFLENYARYRETSRPAAIHTRPLRWHLGDDLGWYDRVFKLEKLGAFEAYVSERAGRPVRVPRENPSAAVTRPLEFGSRHVDLARKILADDYALLAGHYDFDTALESFSRKHALTA
jgi:hypothetical protein